MKDFLSDQCKEIEKNNTMGKTRDLFKKIRDIMGTFQTSLVVQLVKNTPAMWETWFQSLGWEDPPEKGMIPTLVIWPEEFHGQYDGITELDTTK